MYVEVANVTPTGDNVANTMENRGALASTGSMYRERLRLPPEIAISYQPCEDLATKHSSTTKIRFVV